MEGGAKEVEVLKVKKIEFFGKGGLVGDLVDKVGVGCSEGEGVKVVVQ